MADTFYFSRDTKVHLKDSNNVVYNIPVLDGFSFSQSTNTTEVTLNEMESTAGVSRRARQMFTDSYAPAEWSFSTYIRPFTGSGSGAGNHSGAKSHVVEEALWNALAGSGAIGQAGAGLSTPDTNGADLDFAESNVAALDTFDLEFEMGSGKTLPTVYKIANCVVNEVNIEFDIDGIATAQWSGFGSIITEKGSITAATILEGTRSTDTGNFIRNRLTDLTVANIETTQANSNNAVSNSASVTLAAANSAIKVGQTVTAPAGSTIPGDTTVAAISGTGLTLSAASSIAANAVLSFTENKMQPSYDLTLTGGSVTISNNMTYLTPETLGIVNQPLGHVTGTRSISGTFTCYLNTPTTGTSSADLFEDIITSTDTITNSFSLTFVIGGTGNNTRVTMTLPNCHLEVPTHSIDDIISLETSFHALPTSISEKDELTMEFVGTTL